MEAQAKKQTNDQYNKQKPQTNEKKPSDKNLTKIDKIEKQVKPQKGKNSFVVSGI